MKNAIIVFLTMFSFISFVNADADVAFKKKTVDITKLENENTSLDYIHLSTNTNWDNDYIYYDFSYYVGRTSESDGIYLVSAIANVDEVLSSKYMDKKYDEMIPFSNVILGYDFVYGHEDDEDTSEDEFVPNSIDIDILDKDLNLLKHIEFPENFFEDDFYVSKNEYLYFNQLDNGNYVVASTGYSNDAGDDLCSLFQISKEYEVTSLECTISDVKELFPEYEFAVNSDKNNTYYDKLDNRVVFSRDSKLYYYVDDKEVFVIDDENVKFKNVKIMNDYLIVINYSKIETENDTENSNYFSQISVYDLEGNLLQTIIDNSAFIGLDVNNQTNEFVILKKYVDGICSASYAGNLSCETQLKYDVYGVKGVSNELEEEKVDNPDTKDTIIIILSIMLIGSFILVVGRKKLEF